MTTPKIDIDGAIVAETLGLDVAKFRQLMADEKIPVLCERGIGEDAGRFRASFYYGKRRARFIVDANGRIVEE